MRQRDGAMKRQCRNMYARQCRNPSHVLAALPQHYASGNAAIYSYYTGIDACDWRC